MCTIAARTYQQDRNQVSSDLATPADKVLQDLGKGGARNQIGIEKLLASTGGE